MFDLEKAITGWRDQMIAGGVKERVILDELEGHLRDDIAQQTRSASNAQETFEAAVRRIGQPTTLQNEFKKVSAFNRVVARAALAFAGVPPHYTAMNDSSSRLESRWATYLRSAAFLLPAVCLWMLSSIYVVPAFKSILERADLRNVGWLLQINRVIFGLMDQFKDHFIWIICATGLVLCLLERRSDRWPRFRRAALGSSVFMLNLITLLSLFVMFIAATIAAGEFSQHAK